MSRYIDADLLKSKFEYDNNDSPVYVEATKAIHKIIDACPTADVAPVIHATKTEEFDRFMKLLKTMRDHTVKMAKLWNDNDHQDWSERAYGEIYGIDEVIRIIEDKKFREQMEDIYFFRSKDGRGEQQ